MAGYLFTSESVTEGHPDKICDNVSDAVLDAVLAQDPKARVACETMVKTGYVILAGEITTRAIVNFPDVARAAVRDIGYTSSEMGFDAGSCAVLTAIEAQSPDISQGVSEGEGLFKEQGAGDQGLMFGYASDETPDLMPAPISYAHKLAKRLTDVRKKEVLPFLRPDGKTQVTVEYGDDGRPARIDAVVVSSQHAEGVKHRALKEAIIDEVVLKVIPGKLLDKKTKFWINPTGRFVLGGPYADAGLTGRKIIVDTYGGMGRHGGGAFSGKDPSKVDRSACYYARYVAKNIVAAKLARKAEVQVAYAIGVAQPVGVYVTTFGTGVVEDAKIEKAVKSLFDFRPRALIEELDLLRPIYRPTAAYGHFGRSEKTFTWESTARAQELADAVLPKTNGVKAEKASKSERPRAKLDKAGKSERPKAKVEKKSKKARLQAEAQA
jgi:S-adenosylmethionine synthetase